MPEGPEIRRAADRIGKALIGKTIQSGQWPYPSLVDHTASSNSRTILPLRNHPKSPPFWLDGQVLFLRANFWKSFNLATLSLIWTASLLDSTKMCDAQALGATIT